MPLACPYLATIQPAAGKPIKIASMSAATTFSRNGASPAVPMKRATISRLSQRNAAQSPTRAGAPNENRTCRRSSSSNLASPPPAVAATDTLMNPSGPKISLLYGCPSRRNVRISQSSKVAERPARIAAGSPAGARQTATTNPLRKATNTRRPNAIRSNVSDDTTLRPDSGRPMRPMIETMARPPASPATSVPMESADGPAWVGTGGRVDRGGGMVDATDSLPVEDSYARASGKTRSRQDIGAASNRQPLAEILAARRAWARSVRLTRTAAQRATVGSRPRPACRRTDRDPWR